MKKTNNQIISEIRVLLDELETKNSSGGKMQKTPEKPTQKDYSGCIGALRLLVSENYFDQPHNKQEVTGKLLEMGRHYPSSLISMNLLNLCRERVLIKLGERGNYKFVIRK